MGQTWATEWSESAPELNFSKAAKQLSWKTCEQLSRTCTRQCYEAERITLYLRFDRESAHADWTFGHASGMRHVSDASPFALVRCVHLRVHSPEHRVFKIEESIAPDSSGVSF